MRRHQKNKYLMLDAVASYLSGNQSVTANIPVIAENTARLISIQDTIRSYEELQSNAARVAVAKKAAARQKAQFAGVAFAGKLYSLGIQTGSTELRKKYEVTISDFREDRDVILATRLIAIKDDVLENLDALGPHGVNRETYDEFSGIVDNYVTAVGKKETSYAERSAAVKSIDSLFNDASLVLKTLDRLIEEYRTKNPNFFNGYKSARGIRNLGHRYKTVPETAQQPIQQ
jgi:hypothetical protein